MSLHIEQPVENIHLNSSMTPSIVKFPIASTPNSDPEKTFVNTIYSSDTRGQNRPNFNTNDPLEYVSNISNQQNKLYAIPSSA